MFFNIDDMKFPANVGEKVILSVKQEKTKTVRMRRMERKSTLLSCWIKVHTVMYLNCSLSWKENKKWNIGQSHFQSR